MIKTPITTSASLWHGLLSLPSGTTRLFIWRSALLLLGLLFATSCTSLSERAASSDATWRALRARYPYHVQGVALSPADSDRTRTLIIAEPPPHVTLASIYALSPESFKAVGIARHSIGHDGWAKDVVAHLKPLDSRALSDLISRLHQLLFRTSYKAQLLRTEAPLAAARSLNLSVSPDELEGWLFRQNQRFVSFGSSTGIPFETLLSSSDPGVYFSETGGLVAWTLSTARPLEESLIQARVFALETDSIVGAVGNEHHVAIIGRARQNPVLVVPPLRVETLLTLASADTRELGQSYERNTLFAGKYDKKDWAPIYLSHELLNTEFGSLLNITDQILKSWSNNGNTEYKNFAYPKPLVFPFGRPLREEVRATRVTYNWNTEGLAHNVDLGSHKLIVFKDVGALPIHYISDSGRLFFHESLARRYFAQRDDPNLARVVQYTALYQIFREFKISADGSPSEPKLGEAKQVLRAEAAQLVRKLRSASREELRGIAQEFLKTHAVKEPRMELRLQQDLLGYQRALRALAKISGERIVELLAEFMAVPHPEPLQPQDGSPLTEAQRNDAFAKRMERAGAAQMAPLLLQAMPMLSAMVKSPAILSRYADLSAKEAKEEWIHTPSLVISWNSKDPTRVTGGHNLTARVSRYRASPLIPRGQSPTVIDRDGQPLVLFHPLDLPTVTRSSAYAPARPQSVALGIPQGSPLAEKEPAGAREERSLELAPEGWRSIPLTEEIQRQMPQGTASGDTLTVTRDGRGFVLISSSDNTRAYRMSSMADVHDAVHVFSGRMASRRRPLQILLPEHSPDEVDGLALSLKFRRRSSGGQAADVQQVAGKHALFILPALQRGSTAARRQRIPLESLSKRELSPLRKEKAGDFTKVEFDVRIPVPGNKPAKLTIASLFQKLVPSRLASKIGSAVKRVAGIFMKKKAEPTLEALGKEIVIELKKSLPEAGDRITVEYALEGEDILQVLRVRKARGWRPSDES